MPRFYFHLYNDVVTADDEGRMLPDVEAARGVAVQEAREMMTDEVLAGTINLSHRIVVADEDGQVVATISYRDAVAVRE
jgi:hypothetical protein